MPIFGAKSRAMRGCASKLACGRRIGPAECTVFTGIFGEFVTSQRADVGIGPYNHVWTYIRIRRRFTKVQLLSVVRSTEPRPCRLRLL